MSNRTNFGTDFLKSCRHGYECLSEEAQTQICLSVQNAQKPDGLFVSRHDQGDLYYTFFGLLLTVVTHAKINQNVCKQAISSIDFTSLDLVHRCALLRCQRLLKLLSLPRVLQQSASKHLAIKANQSEQQLIEPLRKLKPTSYPQSDPQSPYSQFLLATLYTDFGLDLAPVDLTPYRLNSGLYANFQNDSEYAVNATASALFLISDADREITLNSLCDLQEQDGSFRAASCSPQGDLLSTGATYFALNSHGVQPRHSVKSYLRNCVREDGFFAATPDDPCSDLEYTVYALLALGGTK